VLQLLQKMIRPLIIDKLQHRSATQGAVQYELLSD
jgi:hypothetical protein